VAVPKAVVVMSKPEDLDAATKVVAEHLLEEQLTKHQKLAAARAAARARMHAIGGSAASAWAAFSATCEKIMAPKRRPGAPGDRGQAALAYYDAARAAGRPHSTALLDEATKVAGLSSRRRLEQLISKRAK
jgi:hypothetical protein